MTKTIPTSRLFLERHYRPLSDGMQAGNAHRLTQFMRQTLSQDRILAKLELPHPGEQVFFGSDSADTDRTKAFEITGMTQEAFKQTLKDCPTVDAKWVIANKPFNWLMAMSIKWYAEKGKEEDTKMAVLYLAVSLYATLQFKYFRRFYQPNVMAYAVNSLSDKFTLKQEGTMLKAITSIAWKSHQKYLPLLRSGSDKDLFTYFVSMWSRLNGMVKGLKSHYEEVKASGAYLNQSRETYDDGEHAVRETDGGRVTSISDRVTEAFGGEAIPPRLIDLAAQMADCPRQNLLTAVGEIREAGLEPVREIFRLILELYFEERNEGQEGIRTRGFIGYAHAVYVRSNTKDGRVERAKQILDSLLAQSSPQYLRTNREATKSAFRKGLYLLLVLFLQQQA